MHYNKLFFDFSPTSYMDNYTTTPLFHILRVFLQKKE